jgi:hypothetical protein
MNNNKLIDSKIYISKKMHYFNATDYTNFMQNNLVNNHK